MCARHPLVALLIVMAGWYAISLAEIPGQISFQGKLTRQNGGPIADANYQLTLKIYDAPTLGNVLWTEQDTATTRAGLFQLMMGITNPIPKSVFEDTSAYLAIEFAGTELQPRKPFRSVGYAYHAAVADSVRITPPGDSDWVIDGDNIYHANGNVGIGTANPTERLEIASNGALRTTYLYPGAGNDTTYRYLRLGNLTNYWAGLMHNINSPTYGNGDDFVLYTYGNRDIVLKPGNGQTHILGGNVGIGTSSPAKTLHIAGNGLVLDNEGSNFPIYGASDDIEHDHYLTLMNATGRTSAWGLKAGGLLISDSYSYANPGKNDLIVKGNVGIGRSDPDARLSIANGDGPAASFRNNSTGSVAVWVYNQGGYGLACGTGNISSPALHAIAYNNDAHKTAIECNGRMDATGPVTGHSILSGVNAIEGTSTGNFAGVAGINSGGGPGIYGTSVSGYAGNFSGPVYVSGYLSKAGGGFKIDHPLDPENKYLYHSFVESPDMKNIYDGNVILDQNSEAVVDLPSYFDALNQDFRYQLTCIGGYANVFVAEEVNNNHFKIAGGKPGLKVSWQVTGVRHDAWANSHRIGPEVDKAPEARGKYLNPEEFGKSRNQQIGIPEPARVEVGK